MKHNIIKFTQDAIFFITLAVTISAPLFFLPLTAEFFEFNKFTFLLAATVISSILWGIRMVLQKKFSFTRTPLDIPLLILLLVFFIAAFSSIDQHISIFGTASRPWPSFVSLLTLVAFYFVTSSNLKSKKSIEIVLYTLVGSTVAAAVIAVISYFGIFIPLDFTKFRSFNTLGSANSLALLEAMILPLTVSWVLFSREKLIRLLSAAASVILIISILLIGFSSAYFSLIIGLLLVASIVLKAGKITKPAQLAISAVAIIAIVAVVVRYIPQVANVTLNSLIQNKDKNATAAQNIDTPKNIVLDQRIAWDIATSAIGKRPLFGTGPGTYLFAYTQLKPRAVNNTTSWSIRFDKSSSDFTETIATAGIVGIIAFIIFAATVVRFIWSLLFKSNNNLIYLPVAAVAVTFIASQFFATSSVSTVIPFFIALSSIVVLAKTQDEKHIHEMVIELATLRNTLNWLPAGSKLTSVRAAANPKSASKSQLLPYIFLIVVAAVAFLGVRNQINAWQGEFYYRKALLAALKNDGSATIDNLQRAINVNPSSDTYHRELSATAVNAAITLSSKKDLNDDQKQLINQLAQVAIQQGSVASGYKILPLRVPGISSSNAANWETLSAAYQALIGGLTGADVDTVNTLSQASALDPENPVLHEKMGVLYLKLKNLDSAQRKFEDATVTKPDYGPAHYDLARVLIEKNGDVSRIAQELALAKKYLPANDPAMDDINTKLSEYNKKVEDLQSKINQSAQEATSASPSPSASASASPATAKTTQPAITPKPTPSPALGY